jgi:hypothetical protein
MIKFNFNISAKIMVIVLAVPLLLVSCKKNDDEVITYGNAKFRLVNAVQGSAAQDFYQGDTKISTTAVAYNQASDYLTLKAGVSVVSFKSAGTQEVNATGSIGINTDINYTVFYAKNSTGSGEITGYPENNSTPPAGKTAVRFVNLGTGLTSSIFVSFANGEPITTGLAYGNITGYAVLDPTVELKFSLVSSITSSTSIPASTFQAGKLYTVWFDAANTTTAQYHIVTQN